MVAFLSTEGDLGRNTLQSVGDLLTQILAADPPLQSTNTTLHAAPALARLVRYEGVTSPCTNSQYLAELKRLASADETAAHADFNLQDLSSKEWNLRSLKGKIVLLNFWATWCPPCRRELPDLQFLADAYSDQLIVLGLTDEDAKEVRPFVARMGLKYPILTYSEPAVAKSFGVEGLPKTLIYDAQGKLAAQAVDMRTRAQFESLLQHAGLKKTTAKAP